MADAAASALVKVIFDKLADEAFKKYVRSQGIHSELENLGRELSQIQAVLNDASEKETKDEAVKQWLNDLQHLAYDIDDILDDVATEAMHRELTHDSFGASTSKVKKLIPTCCTNFSLAHRLSPKLDSIATRLRNLERQQSRLGLIEKADKQKDIPSRGNETSLLGSVVVGREGEKEKLLKKLLGDQEPSNQNFSILPIVGMGGVGKTTLARLLYNDAQVKDHFELHAWVCVSDVFDVSKISKTIFEAMSDGNKGSEDLNQLQMALKDTVKNKRFLIVFDDVWTENYGQWENLVLPFHSGAPGSRIIMTTRKDQLLKKLGFHHLDDLESLSDKDAMSLLSVHALGEESFDSHPKLREKGVGIVEKCGGLPLAVKTIGRLLMTKTDEEDWDAVLKSDIWDLQSADEIVPALKLSDYDLSMDLKRLFAYCSLFPKDFLFDKEKLVLLWMAEGYLNQSSESKSHERLGYDCFEKLVSRSFFQQAPNNESFFVMHDLMNDLATYVAGDCFSRFDNHVDAEKKTLARYRHMSFIHEQYVTYHKFEAFKGAKCLRTFLAVYDGVEQSWDSFHLSNKILVDLFPKLPLLRVLSLSHFNISEVPEFIGSLKHLRYLNLSHTKIKVLPENVGNLYNLQTLIIFSCEELTKLPKSFLKLTKLRYLDIRNTPQLEKLHSGIGELKNIQSISTGRCNGFAITELKGLNNLRGELSIKELRKVQSATHAHEAKLSLKGITELELNWGDGSHQGTIDYEVLNVLKPDSDRLKALTVVSYMGIEFPKWVGECSYCQLVHVLIRGCRKCKFLPSLGQLPSLKKLFIQSMQEVEVIGMELAGATGVAFRSLEVLSFKDMSRWEAWSTNNKVSDAVFPCLRALHIKKCPKLINVSLETLPSLEILSFVDMSGWEALPTNNKALDVMFPCVRELRIENCPKVIDLSLEALPLLRVLNIYKCGDGVLRSLVRAASSITSLGVQSISGLSDEVWRGVIKYLGAVEEVSMFYCNEIRYFWESEEEASTILVNLKSLHVSHCDILMSLGEKEKNNSRRNLLSSLRTLSIYGCRSMMHCCCPNSIDSLSIQHCSSLTSVSFPTTTTGGGGQKLKSLVINDCEKLTEHINNTSMPMLEVVNIGGWRNLKSLVQLSSFIHLSGLSIYDCPSFESFPDTQLPNLTSMYIAKCQSVKSISDIQLPNLTGMHIETCQSLKSISDIQLPSLTYLSITECQSLEALPELSNLTLLNDLTITTCPSMDTSFPSGVWPPNLCSLEIGGLKKPISEWSTHNFPTSLVNLSLCYEPHVSNFIQMSGLFPTSLTTLEISRFDNLKSLSMGIQHLTSLQHLVIWFCPKMKHLPKVLLPSLLRLEIYGCPNLSRKCNERGSRYWPLISYIPRVHI